MREGLAWQTKMPVHTCLGRLWGALRGVAQRGVSGNLYALGRGRREQREAASQWAGTAMEVQLDYGSKIKVT